MLPLFLYIVSERITALTLAAITVAQALAMSISSVDKISAIVTKKVVGCLGFQISHATNFQVKPIT
jgi:hypothetical protein